MNFVNTHKHTLQKESIIMLCVWMNLATKNFNFSKPQKNSTFFLSLVVVVVIFFK